MGDHAVAPVVVADAAGLVDEDVALVQVVVVEARRQRRGGEALAPAAPPSPPSRRSGAASPRRPRARPPAPRRSAPAIAAGRMSGTPRASIASTCGSSSRCSRPYSTIASDEVRPALVPASGRRRAAGSSPGPDPRRSASAPGPARRARAARRAGPRTRCPDPAALNQTAPPRTGIRSTVAHGRTRGGSASPTRSRPAAASRSSTHASAALIAPAARTRAARPRTAPAPRRRRSGRRAAARSSSGCR